MSGWVPHHQSAGIEPGSDPRNPKRWGCNPAVSLTAEAAGWRWAGCGGWWAAAASATGTAAGGGGGCGWRPRGTAGAGGHDVDVGLTEAPPGHRLQVPGPGSSSLSTDCGWKKHAEVLKDKCLRMKGMLGGVFRNKCLDSDVTRIMLLAVVRPVVEYGATVWHANAPQQAALESVQHQILSSMTG
jgi:hypothetical protein